MSTNFWLEHVVDAYLTAVAEGVDWRTACTRAEQNKNCSLRLLTYQDLKAKGIPYSRQHIARRVADRTFPAPFNLPSQDTS